MVVLKKKEISGKTYYYLGHTYRERGKLRYKETYIGRVVPKNMEEIKREFLLDIYKERWFGLFEKIKKGYAKEYGKMPKEMQEKSTETFMIEFTYDTNRIEGSKLSFKDTAMLLEHGISPKDKPIRDVKEAESHKKVFYEMLSYKGDLSIGILLKWHKGLFDETKPAIAGKLRDYQVYISGSRFRPPSALEVRTQILEFFRWYDAEKSKTNPVELAALAHVKFETIHPFGDGNGRIGRLLMNFILYRNRYPMIDIKYAGRRSYYNALEKSNTTGIYAIFVQWFFKRYLKDNKRYSQL
jgi:Fic family protein